MKILRVVRRYLLNILILFDISLNVFLFGGSPYETISSRVGKRADFGEAWAIKLRTIIDAIFGPWHCKNSEVPDYGDGLDEVR